MDYVIGSFNIRDFNYSNQSLDGEKIARDFEKIAQIINKEDFAVVGIQEVNAESPVRHLTHILNMNKSIMQEWEYVYSGQASKEVSDPEGYAFIWNAKKLRLLNVPRNNNPRFYENAGGVTLLRPPYYARFTARGLIGGTNFELRLLNVHIRDAISEIDRIKEFDILVKQVLPRCCDHTEMSIDNEVMPANTFMLGDYNLRLDKGPRAQIRIESITDTNYTGKRRYYKSVQEEPTSLRQVAEQQCIGDCYANNYDHFTYEYDLIKKLTLHEERVEALGAYFSSEKEPSKMLQSYRTKISDHVPIKMNVGLKK